MTHLTELILTYCRQSAASQKNHSTWCELTTGLWRYCDCPKSWDSSNLEILLARITNEQQVLLNTGAK